MTDILAEAGTVLATAAPTLASLFGGPLAGQAVAAIERTLGIAPTGDKLAAATALLGATPEQIIALKVEDDAMRSKYLDAGMAIITSAQADRASAREMQIGTKSLITPSLALIVVAGWIVINGFLLSHPVPADNAVIVARILGTLDTALVLVLSFYFGSSSAVEGRNTLLEKALNSTPGK